MARIDAPEFFRHLSNQYYDQNFSIDLNNKTKPVSEEAEYTFLDTIGAWLVPNRYPLETDPEAVLASAEKLVELIKKHQKDIESKKNGCNPIEMAKNLRDKAEKYVAKFGLEKGDSIQKKFYEGIDLLLRSEHNGEVAYYSRNLKKLGNTVEAETKYKELSHHEFYKALSRTGWFSRIGFSDRIHVIQTARGPKVYTSKPSRYYYLRTSNMIEAPARKQASMTEMAHMIKGQLDFIIRECANGNYNEDNMIRNIEGLKGRITRNIDNFAVVHEINKQIDDMIHALEASKKKINDLRNSTIKARLKRFGWNWIVEPIHDKTTRPVFNSAKAIGNTTWSYTGGMVVDAAYDLASGVKKVLG